MTKQTNVAAQMLKRVQKKSEATGEREHLWICMSVCMYNSGWNVAVKAKNTICRSRGYSEDKEYGGAWNVCSIFEYTCLVAAFCLFVAATATRKLLPFTASFVEQFSWPRIQRSRCFFPDIGSSAFVLGKHGWNFSFLSKTGNWRASVTFSFNARWASTQKAKAAENKWHQSNFTCDAVVMEIPWRGYTCALIWYWSYFCYSHNT